MRRKLEKKTRQGLRGYALATLAFVARTTGTSRKVVGSFMEGGNDEAVRMRTWHSEEADVHHDAEIVADGMAFMEEYGALGAAMPDGNSGCPHEEGIDCL